MSPGTVPPRPIRLLSLDGGGVRGLSTILILKRIMDGVNRNRAVDEHLLPWQVFDMIGGTSTGGIIAVMLGRLHMTLEECEDSYLKLSERIFTPTRHWLNIFGQGKDFLQADGRFDANALETAIKECIRTKMPEDTLLMDQETNPSCRVCVVAVRQNNTAPAILRSYHNPEMAALLEGECKIWQACRATSAATTFFDPITIGKYQQTFLDAGILYNNPVQLIYREAGNIWPGQEVTLLSIGTGSSPQGAFKGSLKNIVKAMKKILTETDRTADDFHLAHQEMARESRLFRFNANGLESIGLEEYKKHGPIADATQEYLDKGETGIKLKNCIEKLSEVHSEALNILIHAEGERHHHDIEYRRGLVERMSLSPVNVGWFQNLPEYLTWNSAKTPAILCHLAGPGMGKTWLLNHLLSTWASTPYEMATYFCSIPTTPESVLRSLICVLLASHKGMVSKVQAKISARAKLSTQPQGRVITVANLLDPNKRADQSDLWTLLGDVLDICTTQNSLSGRRTLLIIDGFEDVIIDVEGKEDKSLKQTFISNFVKLWKTLQPSYHEDRNFVGLLLSGRPSPEIYHVLLGVPIIDQELEMKHCLASLYFDGLHARRDRVTTAQEGTNQWIWTHPSYLNWRRRRSGILWIQGKPGSGKSTLAKLITHELAMRTPGPQVIADFFYSARGGVKETNHIFMLKSLLYQVLEQQPDLYRVFQDSFRILRASTSGSILWSYDHLKKILLRLAQEQELSSIYGYNGFNIHFIIDAIDESENQRMEGHQAVNILRLFSSLCSQDGCNFIKIILVSRPEDRLKRELGKVDDIELEKENQADIVMIIEAGIQAIWASRFDDYDASSTSGIAALEDSQIVKDEGYKPLDFEHAKRASDDVSEFMKTYLLENAEGVILWIVLIIEDLKDHAELLGSYTMNDMKARLLTLPRGLEATYTDIINKLHGLNDKQWIIEARSMLTWASFAKRPLTLREFRDAIAMSGPRLTRDPMTNFLDNRCRIEEPNWIPMRQRMWYMCGHLLQIVHQDQGVLAMFKGRKMDVQSTDYVQLHHQTVRDFLVYNESAKPLDLNAIESQAMIAEAALEYLKLSLPLSSLEEKDITEWNNADFQHFLQYLSTRPLLSYVFAYLADYVVAANPPNISQGVLQYFDKIQQRPNRHGWQILQAWWKYHHPRLFGKPLPESSDRLSGQELQEMSFMTMCLLHTAEGNDLSALRILIDASADLDGRDSFGRTALTLAAKHGSFPMVKLLLESQAGVDVKDSKGITPLMLAAESGNLQILDLLLSAGAYVDLADHSSNTALCWAALADCESTAAHLLEQRADIFVRNNLGQSALHIAVARGAISVVFLLAKRFFGQFIKLKDHSGLTALHYAAKHGEEGILSLLLGIDRRIFVDEGDKEGKTALHHAVLSGKPGAKIAKLLLDNKAYINFQDKYGHTPLVCAATCGNEEVAKVLLENQKEELGNCGGLTALSEAAGNGHMEMVQLLLSSRLWPNVGKLQWPEVLNENPGNEILIRAIQGGHTAIANLLMQEGARLTTTDYQNGGISLYLAAESGDLPMADTIVTLGMDGEGPLLPLYEAASHGHVDMVSWLLRNGADLEARSQYQGTALHASAANGYSAVVQYLLEYGADIEAQDNAGWTPLHCAAKDGHEEVVRLLLQKGANIAARTHDGGSVLFHAVAGGHVAVARAMIEHGAEIEDEDSGSWSLLDEAAVNEDVEMLELLRNPKMDIVCQPQLIKIKVE